MQLFDLIYDNIRKREVLLYLFLNKGFKFILHEEASKGPFIKGVRYK